VIEMNNINVPESVPFNNGNPNASKKSNAVPLNNTSPTVAHNGKAAIQRNSKRTTQVNNPAFEADAKTMLYGNQDEVAMLIAKKAFYGKWLHVVKGGTWYNWKGTYWQPDLKASAGAFHAIRKAIREAIKEMKRWVHTELKKANLSPEGQEELVSFAEKADKAKRDKRYFSDIYTLVSTDDKCTATLSQFDRDIHLLGTPIGTIDLKARKFVDTDPRRYISKQTICGPAEGEPVLWLKFLNEIFAGDQEVIDFIQVLCGYALTGETGEEKLFFLYGSGANGKSKFLEILTYILNDYVTRIAPTTLLQKGFSEHPTEIAKLAGARLVLGSELPVGEVWDDQKLKELTGGDTMTARLMRQDYLDFKPQFTLIIAGNHIPQMKHVGEAERRRFVMIPFNVTIPIERRDPKLGEKLQEEAEKILTWCIKGAGMYYQSGLNIPTSILKASQEYLDSEDVVGEFLKTQLTPVKGKEVEIKQLVQVINDWFRNNGHNNITDPKSLRKELKDRGRITRRSGSKYYLQNHDLFTP
jgi:putative DNA primase/helicase